MIAEHKPTIWFHIHIPKTAGSTLRQILRRNFGNGYFSAVSLLEHHKLTLGDSTEIIEKHYRWLRCYSDHRLSLDLPFDSDLVDAKALVFVRDPIEQVVSQYNFHRHNRRRKTEVAEMTLEEFVGRKLNRSRNVSRSTQLQRLKGAHRGTNLNDIRRLLEDERLFLFPQEQFDLACVCLENRFGSDFKSTEYILSNRSVKKTPPSEEVQDQIRSLVSADFELHSMSRWFLDTFAESVFPDLKQQEQALANLRQRCQKIEAPMEAPSPN